MYILLIAAETGNLTKLRELLDKNTYRTEIGLFRRTPLYLVVLLGYRDVVEILLDYRVNISVTNLKG